MIMFWHIEFSCVYIVKPSVIKYPYLHTSELCCPCLAHDAQAYTRFVDRGPLRGGPLRNPMSYSELHKVKLQGVLVFGHRLVTHLWGQGYRKVFQSVSNSDLVMLIPLWPLPLVLTRPTTNLRTETLDFSGFDSRASLILRGGIPRSIGYFPRHLVNDY